MADNDVLLSKKVKTLSIISICLSTIFMVLFLTSILLWKDILALTFTFMILFIASVIFEFVMCIQLFKYLYKKYVGNNKNV